MNGPAGAPAARRPRAGRRGALAAVLSGLLWGLAGPVPAQPVDDARAAVKAAELERLQARMRELRRSLKASRGRYHEVERQLRRVERRIGKVTRGLRQVQTEIEAQGDRLAELRARRRELQKALDQHRQLLARQIRASYIMGRQEQLKILLNQGDPATVRRALVYYDYLNRSRTARIQSALAQLRELRQVETQIAERKQRLEQLRARRKQQKEELQQSRHQRRRVLAALDREITAKGRRLERMQQDEQRLRRVLSALEDALSDIPLADHVAFAERKGRLPWPAQGRILERYGSPRGSGNLRWRGILIGAKRGQAVRAISYGRVAFADWLRGYGLLLIIDHGDGFMSLYGHNQSLFKEVGEWVQPGERVASVGDSGGRPRDALYFEIRRRGKPVNPMGWCARPRGNRVGLK